MGEGELGLGATISGRSTIIAQLLQAQQRPVIQSVNQVSSQQRSSPLLTQAPSASHVLGESRTPRTLLGMRLKIADRGEGGARACVRVCVVLRRFA